MRRIGCCGVLLLLAGCAAAPASRAPAGDDETALAEIDAALVEAAAAFERGVEARARDELPAAAEAFERGRTLLADAGARCAATTGCALERILDAQQAALAAQAAALAGGPAADLPERPLEPVDERERTAADTALARERARAARLLKGRDLAEFIEVNEPVRAALEEWLTWMRPQLLDSWEHYQYMRHLMWPAYEQAGLPEALLFGILAKESGGRVHAVSRAGATGPLQFMPATGRRYGLGWEAGFDLRYDPAAAARANVAYIGDQLRRFNDDLELVLAAYNGGEGRLGRLSPGGSRRFWDRVVFDGLPAETREYVPMVLAAAWLFLHPEDYGLVWPSVDATPGRIRLERAQTLRELAVCLGQEGNPRGWFRTLRNLNARIDPATVLPEGSEVAVPARVVPVYAARCVDGPLAATARELHLARMPAVTVPVRSATDGRVHVVRRGETLGAIARRYGCRDARVIASENGIRPPHYAIRAGERLRVPPCARRN